MQHYFITMYVSIAANKIVYDATKKRQALNELKSMFKVFIVSAF